MPSPETSAPPSRLARLRGWAIGAAALAAVAALLVYEGVLDPARFSTAMRAVGLVPLAIGMLGGIGVVALQTWRWWFLARPVAPFRYRDAYATVLVGGLLNAVLPAHAGDVLRVQYLSDRTGASRATLLGTEVVDLCADKAGWLPAFVLFALTGAPPPWMLRAVVVMLTLALALLAALAVVRRSSRDLASGAGFRARFTEGITGIGTRRLATAALGLAVLPWVWETLVIARAADAAGIRLAPLDAFVLLTAFNLAMIVPVPGNMGTFEAASSSVLASLGVPLEGALAFSLVYHASQLLPYVLGGGLALLIWRVAPAARASLEPLADETPLERGPI